MTRRQFFFICCNVGDAIIILKKAETENKNQTDFLGKKRSGLKYILNIYDKKINKSKKCKKNFTTLSGLEFAYYL